MPVGAREDARADVGEQHERQPFEEARDAAVRGPEEEGHDDRGVDGDQDARVDPGHHLGRFGHPAEVGADVEDVRDREEPAGGPEHATAVTAADHAREAAARDHPEPRAHELDGDHEREREERRPELCVPEGRARDRVGGDPRGVVVGRPGDEPGAEVGEEPPETSGEEACGGAHAARPVPQEDFW